VNGSPNRRSGTGGTTSYSRCLLQALRIIPVLLPFSLLAGLAFGQSNVGEISGQVTDSTGVAVPGCAVTTNNSNRLQATLVTQENGIFVFAALPEGKYNVVAEKQGFRTSEHAGVALEALRAALSISGWSLGAMGPVGRKINQRPGVRISRYPCLARNFTYPTKSKLIGPCSSS
jgi:Carboxypeptidase regulatory-like domain